MAKQKTKSHDHNADTEEILFPPAASSIITKNEQGMLGPMPSRINPKRPQRLYLWLCCEGWMRFGPFEWLRFDDERQAIIGPDGAEVAKNVDGQWRVSVGRGEGMQFSNPTITTTPVHPHRDCGGHSFSKI